MRSYLALLLTALSCSAAPMGFISPAPSLQYGLIGWWTMNDGTGASAADLSGFGRTGTLYNSPTWPAAVIGQGLQFNGTTGYMDASCPLLYTSAVSTSMWVKNLSDTSLKGFFEMVSSDNSQIWCIYISGANNGFVVSRVGGAYCFQPANAVTTTAWMHIVLTVPANSNAVTIYVNGVQNSMTVASGLSQWTAAGHINVGRGYNSSLSATTVMDDVRVYSRELSADEVKGLYGGGSGR